MSRTERVFSLPEPDTNAKDWIRPSDRAWSQAVRVLTWECHATGSYGRSGDGTGWTHISTHKNALRQKTPHALSNGSLHPKPQNIFKTLPLIGHTHLTVFADNSALFWSSKPQDGPTIRLVPFVFDVHKTRKHNLKNLTQKALDWQDRLDHFPSVQDNGTLGVIEGPKRPCVPWPCATFCERDDEAMIFVSLLADEIKQWPELQDTDGQRILKHIHVLPQRLTQDGQLTRVQVQVDKALKVHVPETVLVKKGVTRLLKRAGKTLHQALLEHNLRLAHSNNPSAFGAQIATPAYSLVNLPPETTTAHARLHCHPWWQKVGRPLLWGGNDPHSRPLPGAST